MRPVISYTGATGTGGFLSVWDLEGIKRVQKALPPKINWRVRILMSESLVDLLLIIIEVLDTESFLEP